MICVSLNTIIFIILSLPTILSTCFERDLTLRTRFVRVLSKIVFIFTVENTYIFFRRSYSINASIYFCNVKVFTLLSAVYICPGPNDFCLRKSKLNTRCFEVKPWTSWTVDAHANVKENWVRLRDGDADSFLLKSQFHIFQ